LLTINFYLIFSWSQLNLCILKRKACVFYLAIWLTDQLLYNLVLFCQQFDETNKSYHLFTVHLLLFHCSLEKVICTEQVLGLILLVCLKLEAMSFSLSFFPEFSTQHIIQTPMFINQTGIKMTVEILVSLCSFCSMCMFPVAVTFYRFLSENS
jgi:hypothetical protein